MSYVYSLLLLEQKNYLRSLIYLLPMRQIEGKLGMDDIYQYRFTAPRINQGLCSDLNVTFL